MPRKHPILILPSQKYLRECFTYNKRTGELRWKPRPRKWFKTHRDWAAWNTLYAGKEAGTFTGRYYAVRLLGIRYQVHRVIWKMITGSEPAKTPDHINNDSSDNRWMNLRLASPSEQQYNSRIQKNNTSGYRGVRLHSCGRWVAAIGVNGVTRHLGLFDTKEEAVKAWNTVARKLHGKFYRR